MSSMKAIPVQPALETASITTTPGSGSRCRSRRRSRGISVTALNSAPNRSSQMIGCTSAMNRNAGCRAITRR
jgi:hypothetical protein